jgi:hypothetical protein
VIGLIVDENVFNLNYFSCFYANTFTHTGYYRSRDLRVRRKFWQTLEGKGRVSRPEGLTLLANTEFVSVQEPPADLFCHPCSTDRCLDGDWSAPQQIYQWKMLITKYVILNNFGIN